MIDFVLEISFRADAALEDEVQTRLYLSGSSGSSSSESGGIVTVTAWFESAERRAAAMEMLRDSDAQVRSDERPRVDWLERYEQSLAPLFIGRSFVVAPDAALIAAGGDRLRIILPQEQAFGTGSHETTSLCLEMLERIDVEGRRGLDIGAGSGILAIAMHRLGAQKVFAFDNDPDAYGPLRDNRRRNDVPERAMPIFIGGVQSLRGGAFDIVTMNIVPEVIIPLIGEVTRQVRGHLLLSGILITGRDDVVAAASNHGLRLQDEAAAGEWWAGLFSKRSMIQRGTSG